MIKLQLTKIYLIASVIIIFSVLAFGASQVIAYFKVGANSSILMQGSAAVNNYYQPKIKWQPLQNQGRIVEAASLDKLSKDYLAAHYHKQVALHTGQVQGLNDYFTEKARQHLVALVNSQTTQQQYVRGTTIAHNARLDFFAEDGTVATLTDKVISFKRLYKGNTTFSIYDTAQYRVMLLLEDNYWRIRHIVKQNSIDPTKNQPPDSTYNKPTFLNSKPEFIIKGLNYYPRQYPWQEMWANFDSIPFEQDFKRVQQLGFNTIRVFVPYHAFGASHVKPEQLNKLKALLDHAHKARLKVIVTLFDFFLGYKVEEWTLADRHAETIVKALKRHPALLAWDLKNEPDLDFENMGKQEVLEWLHFMAQRLKGYDAHTPLTIGWSQPEAMQYLQEQQDFLTFHYYRNPAQLKGILQAMNLQKPVFMGETGAHSYNAWWFLAGQSASYQLDYYQQIGPVIKELNLHYAFWTLYDFAAIPSNVAGRWPWQKGPQKSFGIIDQKLNPKQSYKWVQTFNTTTK